MRLLARVPHAFRRALLLLFAGAPIARASAVAEAQQAGRPDGVDGVDGVTTARLMARDVSLRAFGMREGLPQGSVIQLTVDRAGYVWGATFGGIFRFDGRQIIGFDARAIPALEGNAATAVAAAANGDLYFASPLGLVGRMRNGRLLDTLARMPVGFERPIDELLVDGRGDLWANVGQRALVYRGGRWIALSGDRVSGGFALDRAGDLLTAGVRGVNRERGGRFEVVIPAPIDTQELKYGTGAITVDERQQLWLARGKELTRYAGGRAMPVPGFNRAVYALQSDGRGTLWIAAVDGVYRVRGISTPGAVSMVEPVAATRAAVVSLAITADGAVVAGLRGDGFLMIRPTLVASATFSHPDFRAELSSLVSDGVGGLWVASGCSSLAHVSARLDIIDTIGRPQDARCVRSVARDARGNIWFGVDGGVRRRSVDGRVRDWVLSRDPVSPVIPRPLLVDGDTLRIGLSDGRIARIGLDDSLVIEPQWATPTQRPIESLARASDGTLWVGQMGALSRWRGATVATFGRAAGVPSVVPRVLVPRAEGGVLIGSYGSGLLYYQPARGVRAMPLVDNTVTAIVADREGQYWLSGNRGLTVLTDSALRAWIADSTAAPSGRLLNMDDGAQEANYGQPAGTRLDDGRLIFASTSGLMVVTPQRLGVEATPSLQIDAVRASRGFKTMTGELAFASDERVVDVYFSMPTYRYTEQAQFRYRLEGRDADWIRVGEERHIQLAGLRPGRVTLRLAGRVPGGAWREVTPVLLNVAPMWWERRSLQLLLLVLVIGIITVVVWQRLRAVQADARAREIAAQAQRDTAAMSERHQRELAQVGRVAVAGELTASLSHELGQPLAAIVNNAEVARRLVERARTPGAAWDPLLDEVLQDVSSQGRRASEVVREFRRFLRREAGAREQLVVRELLESTIELLRREYADAGVRLTWRVAPATPTVQAERVLIQQVCVNLLQNALEAVRGRPGAAVLLRARPVGAGVRLTVADNGPGFAPAIRPTAFEPFVTARASGMGMGLAITRRIVEAHGGHVAIGRIPGAGAAVSVWLPSATSSGRLDTVATVTVATV